MTDYWKDTIAEAFESVGLTASEEQITEIANWAEGAHDFFGQAHGHDVMHRGSASPIETDKDREIASLKRQIEQLCGDIQIYRKSVATRRGVSVNDVELDRHGPGHGDVIYSA